MTLEELDRWEQAAATWQTAADVTASPAEGRYALARREQLSRREAGRSPVA